MGDLRRAAERFDDERKIFEKKIEDLIESDKKLKNINESLVKKNTRKGKKLKSMQEEVMRMEDEKKLEIKKSRDENKLEIKKLEDTIEKMEDKMREKAFGFVEFEHLRQDLKCLKIKNH